MELKKQKTRAVLAGTVLILSQMLATLPMVSAQSTADAYTKCDEGVHPFDPTKTELTGSTADSLAINFPGESHCFSNLTGSFPTNQHVDPNPSTHDPKSTNYTVPKALHSHHYINESSTSDGYYKRAWVQTFKIKLQSDLKTALKAGTLYCPIPDDGNPSHYDTNFANCPANYTNAKVFGGTKLQFDGTTLTYTFGVNQPVEDPPGSGSWYVKPLVPGKNNSGEMPGTSGSWQSRAFGMAIDFETKDMRPGKTIWSGTSTSQAEVIHTAIPKAAFNAIPSGMPSSEAYKGKYRKCGENIAGHTYTAAEAWCNVGSYHWVDIGTVATVWEAPGAPPPPTCLNVVLTPNQLNSSGSTGLSAKVNLSDGSSKTATVKWQATGGNLTTTEQTGPTSANFLNNYTLTGASGSVKVWVDSLVGATNSPACQNGVTVETPTPPVCVSVALTPAQLNASGSTALSAKVTLSDGSSKTATVKWQATGGNLTTTEQTGPTSANFLNNYTLTGATGSVKVWVDSLVGATNSAACQNGKTVETPPPACTGLTINPTGPFNESQLPQTITVNSTTTGGLTLDYKWTSSVPGLVTYDGVPGTYYDTNNTATLDNTGPITSDVTITVEGVNKSNHAEEFGPLCQKSITIKPPPKPYCEYVSFNKTEISNTGSDTVSATVHYNDGKDRNTEVTWSPVNLNLSPATNPEIHSSVTPFTKVTNPVVPGNPVSVNAKVTNITPLPEDTLGVDNSPACLAGVTASSTGENICQNLNNSGYTGTTVAGGSTVLFAPNPTNQNPPPPPFVTWTESGAGVLIRNPAAPWPFNTDAFCPAAINDTTVSLPRGCQYFYQTPSTTGTSGFVTITANPNLGNVAACTQTTSFNNQPEQNICLNLNVTKPNPNLVCVTPNPPGTASAYDWTVNGVLQGNHTNCQGINPSDTVSVVAQGAPQCNAFIPPEQNQCNYVTPTYNGEQLCIQVNGTYSGPFTWQIGGGAPFQNGLCQNVPPNTLVNVTGPTPACSVNNYLTPPNPPRLNKTVRALNPPESTQGEKGGSVPLTLVPNIEGKTVEYKITFTPTSPYTTTTIIDDISKSYIQGITNTGSNGGRIVYDDNMNVTVPLCSDALKSGCYSGDIGTPGGITLVKVSNPVIITYRGRVVGSLLTEENCQDNTSLICQEKYPNTATANYQIYASPDEDAEIILSGGPLSASALVQSFCQYILTRAAGDIYLETDLNFGKDIYLCSEYRSSTGLIVTPAPPTTPNAPSTGGQTVPIGHEICSTGQAGGLSGELQNLYGKDISTYLSSQICEVKLRPGESWSKSTITSTIQENKTRVSRWEPNLNNFGNLITTFDDSGLPATNTGVYHLTDNNLTLGSGSDLVLNDGQGAKTFIVENGDLIIKNNIKYGACNKPDGNCTVRDTASLAFIVLNGNVIVDPGVTEISGIYFVQQGDNADSGRLKASGDSYTRLTIYGSVYGDIQDLFTHHKFAGDPAANEGSVVIRFDERIILNTPPGLQDLLQLSQSEVAR